MECSHLFVDAFPPRTPETDFPTDTHRSKVLAVSGRLQVCGGRPTFDLTPDLHLTGRDGREETSYYYYYYYHYYYYYYYYYY